MKFYDLEDKLCEQIELITDPNLSHEEKMKHADVSVVVCSLSKQLINYADVVLRTEKLVAEGKLTNSMIENMIRRS